MATKETIEVPGLGDSSGYAYSQCVVAGDFVFVAGQTGVNKDYNVVSDEFGPQARQTIRNAEMALEAAGSRLEDIVTMTVYLKNMSDGREFLEIRKELMAEGLAPSALIGGVELAFPTLLVEIQATAVRR